MNESDELKLIRPFELQLGQPKWLNRWSPDDVWNLFTAAGSGSASTAHDLLTKDPSLVQANYWYTTPLHIAAREGHKSVVIELLQHKTDLGELPLLGRETIALVALDHGHVELAEYLENQNFSLISEDCEIHHAVQHRDYKLVDTILTEDIQNIDLAGTRAKTPLHYAVENEDLRMVKLLVELGAKVDPKAFSSDDRLGSFGFRPITSALWYHGFWRQRNCYEIVKYLVSKRSAYTLPIAAACGDLKRVEVLLKRQKIDPNYQESGGKRALSAAAERNHGDIVELLLQHGADPNLAEGPCCPHGFALWSAARFGFKDIVQILLDHGANPNAQVDSSGSPIEATRDPEIQQLLSQHGGQISIIAHFHNKNIGYINELLDKHPQQLTETEIAQGFAAAVRNSDAKMVQLLLNRGFKVPSTVTICQTYLWHDLKLAEMLLCSGMDPNLPNWQRMSPLHHMAAQGNFDAAKLFFKYGANPFLVDVEYQSTPLGWAAREGQTDFVKFLLSYDSRLKYVHPPHENEGSTPLRWASKRGHQDIVELLA